MNIVVDCGNTSAKVGIFNADLLEKSYFFKDAAIIKSFIEAQEAENIIVSSVSFPAADVLSWSRAKGKKINLTAATYLPIKILYKTPQTLGVDRIAAVCGALHVFPGKNCLVIDAGTCLTYEFIDAYQHYHGGAISPGVQMRFEAMHHFTAKLPLAKNIPAAELIGNTTESCLQSGVVNGIKAEVDGIVRQYINLYPDLKVLLCGGDAPTFEGMTGKNFSVHPELVLLGLHTILTHNVMI